MSQVKYAKSVLSGETNAIMQVAELLDNNFDLAVEKILKISKAGRVVVSGMGKAGFVAMKISATLASTGVPSYFLHPAEAPHGDLGRYSPEDIALILSNSGETPEILKMLGLIKRMGCTLISITGRKDSQLAKHSDIVLNIGKVEEVCPLKLAPTASTTAMLALGDALAMTVLKEQNFTREQFAQFHPGGSLGRKLMLVSEVMRSGEFHTVVSQEISARSVLEKINSTRGRPGAAAITDQNNKLVGFFTDGDFMRHLAQDISFLDQPIKNIMSKNPKTISTDQLAEEAVHLMHERKIDQIVVVDAQHQPVGLVDIQDLLDLKS